MGAARVGRWRVAPLRVGLPDLDHGVAGRLAVAVQHAAHEADALAVDIGRTQVTPENVWGSDAGERRVAVLLGRQAVGEEGADRLRRRLDQLGFPAAHVRFSIDRKSTRLNSSHSCASRIPYSACKKKQETHTD